jgi:hypothetical protein
MDSKELVAELLKPEKVRFDNPVMQWEKAFTEASRWS